MADLSRVGSLPTKPDARPPTYALTRWLFLRLLGIVYLVAFWSLGVQIRSLVGQFWKFEAEYFG